MPTTGVAIALKAQAAAAAATTFLMLLERKDMSGSWVCCVVEGVLAPAVVFKHFACQLTKKSPKHF
jgi:hypothetical protein